MTARAEYLAAIPSKYRTNHTKALEGACSPRQAIKAQCLVCCGFQTAEVAECATWRCPLHAYRPYQRKEGA